MQDDDYSSRSVVLLGYDDPTLGTRRSPDRCHQHTPKNCAHLSSVARGRYHRHCPQWQCFVGGVRAIGAGGAGAHWPTICPRTFSWELSWLADDRDDLSGKTGKQKRKKIKLLHSAEALSSHTPHPTPNKSQARDQAEHKSAIVRKARGPQEVRSISGKLRARYHSCLWSVITLNPEVCPLNATAPLCTPLGAPWFAGISFL